MEMDIPLFLCLVAC